MSSLSFTLRLLAMLFGAAFATAALTPGNAKAEYEPEWEQLIGGYGVEETVQIKPFGVAIAELFGFTQGSPKPSNSAATSSTKSKQAAGTKRRPLDPKSLRTTIETKDWINPDGSKILDGKPALKPRPNPERVPAGQAFAGQSGDATKAKPLTAAQMAQIAPAAGGKTAPAQAITAQTAKRAPAGKSASGKAPAGKSGSGKPGVKMFPEAQDYLMRTFEGRWTASDCGTRYWQVIRTGKQAFRVLQWQAGQGTFREDRVTLRTDRQNLELHWVLGSEKAVRTASAGKPTVLQASPGGEKRVEILGILDRTHYDVAGRGKSQPFQFYRARRCDR